MTTIASVLPFLILVWLPVSKSQPAPAVVSGRGLQCPVASESDVIGLGLLQQERKISHTLFEGRSIEEDKSSEELIDGVNFLHTARRSGHRVDPKKSVAEFVAMALFVFIGCGSAMSVAKEPGWVLQVALTFGLAIIVLAYTVGHYSGAQINCAVTFGLMLYGEVPPEQGACNILAQILGAVAGAAILKMVYPAEKDLTGSLGMNSVSKGWSQAGAFVAEFVATFLLVYVVFETAVNGAAKANASFAPLAIGLAVFLAHSVLIPIDGCSINPTRSLGPAMVQCLSGAGFEPFKDMWVFWAGPLAGAASAAGLYSLMASA